MAQDTLIYMDQGGDGINFDAGAAIKFAGTDRRDALAAVVAGAAAGYKLARGTSTINAAPKVIATSLTTVVAAFANLTSQTAPGLNVSTLAVKPSATAGSIEIYGWKPTGQTDTTLVAGTSTQTLAWFAIGT